ncbi:3D-(3,5/4)-trihydroxycyclohexane-1,2-dione acylhydrolase (decyclizing) [Ligilactobacillus sp. WILCCON 0076]|uniref:3D-(3,5/4)-trihydroxycyclohexane-1,2-dione acylhydrolase (Decyclizing) n=1 Tax=Ligilactobacillus ubinensis TaxID=2876789 RepID=A0A9X2FKR8_9LACO|nr:3D-(3,5/4)-trihydroxycyclohexane-1,2-dione acylhydrolase (decyclizing) [Ligilactobacillus ubinensis]MCP0887494.1 3D-(3,5/4)-trihydroxycyclohexane-1,2-dione acylhydrolase (decyclizing) [Ligilactobacillus ubinensis]
MSGNERTVRLTTAQALVKFLNQQYLNVDGKIEPFVEGVFGIFGHGNVLGLGEALFDNPGRLKVFQGHNEQGMASSAIAFSRESLRKKVYAVTASAGPGSANFVTAAGNAYVNNIPLLILPADTFASRQPDPVLQQIEPAMSSAVTTNDSLKAVSKYWDRIERPEQLMSALIKGFEVLTNPATTGPVTICLPQDTEAEAWDYPESFFKKRVYVVKRIAPSEYEMEKASEILKSSKKPVIILGGGAKYSEAGEAIKRFSSLCEVPIVETATGKSTISYNFRNNLGGVGVLGTSAANEAVDEADLIIAAGSRYTDFTTSSKTSFDPNKVKVINVNLSRIQALKLDGFPVVADIKSFFEKLLTVVTDYKSQYNNLSELKVKWNVERDRLSKTTFDVADFEPEIAGHYSHDKLIKYSQALDTKLTQTSALIAMNEHIEKDAVIVAAAGSLPGDVHRIWNPYGEYTYHMEYGYSMMGYEVPAALGIKLAKPDKEVYSLVGDGSFLMLHSELVTAIQYNKKINVVLFNNSGFHSINNLQMSHGQASFLTEFKTENNGILNIDYAKVAEGYGAVSYKVNTVAEFMRALDDAKKQQKSTLIEVRVLPKTMTHGYGKTWWHVGDPEVSPSEKIKEVFEDTKKHTKEAFKY